MVDISYQWLGWNNSSIGTPALPTSISNWMHSRMPTVLHLILTNLAMFHIHAVESFTEIIDWEIILVSALPTFTQELSPICPSMELRDPNQEVQLPVSIYLCKCCLWWEEATENFWKGQWWTPKYSLRVSIEWKTSTSNMTTMEANSKKGLTAWCFPDFIGRKKTSQNSRMRKWVPLKWFHSAHHRLWKRRLKKEKTGDPMNATTRILAQISTSFAMVWTSETPKLDKWIGVSESIFYLLLRYNEFNRTLIKLSKPVGSDISVRMKDLWVSETEISSKDYGA